MPQGHHHQHYHGLALLLQLYLQPLSGLILCLELQGAALPAPVVHELCSLHKGLDLLHDLSRVTSWEDESWVRSYMLLKNCSLNGICSYSCLQATCVRPLQTA